MVVYLWRYRLPQYNHDWLCESLFAVTLVNNWTDCSSESVIVGGGGVLPINGDGAATGAKSLSLAIVDWDAAFTVCVLTSPVLAAVTDRGPSDDIVPLDDVVPSDDIVPMLKLKEEGSVWALAVTLVLVAVTYVCVLAMAVGTDLLRLQQVT